MAEAWQQPSGATDPHTEPPEPQTESVQPEREPATRPQEQRPPRPPRSSRRRSAADRITKVNFPLTLRGYDKAAVDQHLAEMAKLVEQLEASQLRENVVQRALDEVGEQTSGILRRAHEAADEIAAQSRAQAEGRIQRAEREAEITRREADRYAEEIAADTQQLWEERTRLLEEMRQFAEDVLAVADDASERLPSPVAGEPEAPAAAAARQHAGKEGEGLDGDGVIEVDPATVEVDTLDEGRRAGPGRP